MFKEATALTPWGHFSFYHHGNTSCSVLVGDMVLLALSPWVTVFVLFLRVILPLSLQL